MKRQHLNLFEPKHTKLNICGKRDNNNNESKAPNTYRITKPIMLFNLFDIDTKTERAHTQQRENTLRIGFVLPFAADSCCVFMFFRRFKFHLPQVIQLKIYRNENIFYDMVRTRVLSLSQSHGHKTRVNDICCMKRLLFLELIPN